MNDPLFESFCSIETLSLAWQRVKLNNTAGAVDRQTVENYLLHAEQNIQLLSSDLLSGKNIQRPYLLIIIH